VKNRGDQEASCSQGKVNGLIHPETTESISISAEVSQEEKGRNKDNCFSDQSR